MPAANQRVATYIPTGLVDSLDGNTARTGAMAALANLIPSPSTNGLYVCRPASFPLTKFTGFASPGYISAATVIGTRIYGLLATARNAGHDEPFCYDTATSAFIPISGVTAANTPTSPATTGAWTPPTMAGVGSLVLVTHPGFTQGSGNLFGWFDVSGFTATDLTGTVTSGSNVITAVNNNPFIEGVTPGMTITDGSGLIPAGTTINGITVNGTTYTIILSAQATGTHAADTFTIKGGTSAAPLWAAGNTMFNGLPSVPLAVNNFNGRAYFACGNFAFFSDSLVPLSITAGTQFLTIGGADPIIALAPQPFFSTTQGGIVAAILAFKSAQIYQITGDAALSSLALNKIVDGVGTLAPRSIENTPLGVVFEAQDGIRTINLYGQVDSPNPDLITPFINALVPSRSAAAYNEGVYRICSSAIIGGVSETFDRWFDVNRQIWTGPHSLTYDNVVPFASTFAVSSPNQPGILQQANVLPGSLDSFTENGTELTFSYQTALLPEGPAMSTQTLLEASIFASFSTQVSLTANVLDPAENVLLTYGFVSPFMPPANPTNWGLLWSQNVTIPTRCAMQVSGASSQGVALGSIFARFNVESQTNALNVANIVIPSSLDFGSVADPIINTYMDWGSVGDPVLATVDFEVIGPLPGGP